MKYYITLNENVIDDKDGLLYAIEALLKTKLLTFTKVEFIENPQFDYVLKITTDKKITEYFGTIYNILKDILITYNFTHRNIEIFDIDFDIVCERFEKRFLSRRKVCDYLYGQDNNLFNIEIKEIIDKNSITKIAYSEILTPEEFGVSVATIQGCDEWDMASAPFTPISSSRFEDETNNFIQYWQLDTNLYKFINRDEIESILRNCNDWDCNEYIIKTGKGLLYFSTVVNHS